MTDITPVVLRAPHLADGRALWQMAVDSATLDVNSPYAYVLWCRDFAATSVIAEVHGEPAGFVTGYRRPDEPTVLMVWQVAVNDSHRGVGLAGRMLDHLFTDATTAGITHLETTITPDNEASQRLFAAFARRWGADMARSEMFSAELLGDGHLAEELYRIGPLRTGSSR